jgi:hypothetical protein
VGDLCFIDHREDASRWMIMLVMSHSHIHVGVRSRVQHSGKVVLHLQQAPWPRIARARDRFRKRPKSVQVVAQR